MMMRIHVPTGLLALLFVAGALPAEAQSKSRKESYTRPTAEEALAFLKTLPPVGRKVDGKPQMVQEWADKTVKVIGLKNAVNAKQARDLGKLRPGLKVAR